MYQTPSQKSVVVGVDGGVVGKEGKEVKGNLLWWVGVVGVGVVCVWQGGRLHQMKVDAGVIDYCFRDEGKAGRTTSICRLPNGQNIIKIGNRTYMLLGKEER